MTSPPYTKRNDLDDALAAYTSKGSGYAAYLADMRAIYRQVAAFMREGARAVVEIANIKGTDGVTTLAWDVAEAIGHVLRFDGEVVVAWEPTYGYGYDHSYCLIFSKPQMP